MNIFYLDKDPIKCAMAHNDKHVVKMILEYAQLMSTAHRILDDIAPYENDILYKACYINHPCGKWIRQTSGNYDYTFKLWRALCGEYTYRYEKIHKTETRLLEALKHLPKNILHQPMTKPVLAMPDDVKNNRSALLSYRAYYNVHKKHLLKYTKREIPKWVQEKA
tara:strand:- start:13559 stop:14053 length:495 start_codon:yes stop_codon:yes gene_type:complete